MIKRNRVFKMELLVLTVLSKGDCYRYDICKHIKEETEGLIDSKEGVMYPILYNLINENYISSYEKLVDHGVRVYYHIEESGRAYLMELKDEFQKKMALIQKMIEKAV